MVLCLVEKIPYAHGATHLAFLTGVKSMDRGNPVATVCRSQSWTLKGFISAHRLKELKKLTGGIN